MNKRNYENFSTHHVKSKIVDNRIYKRSRTENAVTSYKVLIRNDDDPHVFMNTQDKYVKIGNFIYKTKLYYNKQNSDEELISLSKSQYDNIKSYIFEDNYVTVSKFNKTVENINTLKINITSKTTYNVYIDREVIINYIQKNLTNHVVTHDQKFDLFFKNIPLEVKIQSLDDLYTGMITDTTFIDFCNIGTNIIIQNKCSYVKNKDIKVHVITCVDVSTDSSHINRFPVIIEEEDIAKQVLKVFSDKFINYTTKTFIIQDYEYTVSIHVSRTNKQSKYKNTYKLLKDDSDFIIKSLDKNIIITKGNETATKICFNCTCKNKKGNFIVSYNDLISSIYTGFNKISSNQDLECTLNNKKFLLNIEYIYPKSTNNVAYYINRKTKIIFNTDIESNTIIVQNKKPYNIKTVDFKISENKKSFFFLTQDDKAVLFDNSKLEKIIRNKCAQIIAVGFKQVITYNGKKYTITCKNLEFENAITSKRYPFSGEITGDTKIKFVISKNSKNMLTGNNSGGILNNPIQELEKHVGGISEELKKVIRTICLSRGKLKDEYQSRGLKPVKGIIFYGPPGTGKTSVARNLGKLLGCEGDQFRLMSGPEIFNKYVGESESNVRDIFKAAKDAWKKYGDKSPTYMVVIDEIDAMLPSREGNSSSPVRDSVVNQFLAEMDGLEQFNNFICIGITNRLELLDPAVKRSGRFGIHIKIDLPSKEGRIKIFEIHTNKLSNKLGKINFERLSDLTDGLSGADIESIVELASIYSLERLNEFETISEEIINEHGKITQDDFICAIKEISSNNKKSKDIESMTHMYM
ncbi:AAA family ATPase [Acanthamoeba polyphaga moumouvirus]|uniref:AAA family ATPase n=1 Tax=Acanthamoeba polyphaga moumouvirus TaxID=1269028 RepID=L7RCB4_9VIRU|nr:AAA family ATPase [Acanthamoeba polyphaga moumouvirus]AGC01871.1 AAA family ATPase [Acanthamoeba polyphaga moumouvirus]